MSTLVPMTPAAASLGTTRDAREDEAREVEEAEVEVEALDVDFFMVARDLVVEGLS